MGSDLRHYADALADKISIHAPRMGSDDGRVVGPVDGVLISIHAPRMGSDFSWRGLPPTVDISIHAPRMGSDLKRSDDMTQKILFQSTLPGWGATNRRYCSVSRMANFNPRSPDGERLHLIVDLRHRFGISIHAPRMGSDESDSSKTQSGSFQSTLPGWGATAKMDIFAHDMGKIIHFQH